jgi:glycosyltransferase involved in cell wall biosynthesis
MISILMPIYNGIEFINDSVMSIIQQKYTNWELIIGINGHPPNSDVFKIAQKYVELHSNIRVYDFVDIKGKSNALNEMIKYCKYEWISLLDVDDVWLPDKLEKQVPYMESYDVIGTKCYYFENLNISPTGSPGIPLGDISGFDFCNGNPIINSSCLIKKKLCWWNSIYDGIEDYDLWLRLWKNGYKFYNVHDIQVLHRVHPNSAFNAKGNNTHVGALVAKFR